MNVITVLALIFMSLALVLCVVRLFLGPTTPDRVVAASIMKGKTFSAPSTDREYIYAKLVRNLECYFLRGFH